MTEKRYFEWLDGESVGSVTVLKNVYEDDGVTYYEFEDGECCAKEFVAKMTDNIKHLKNKFLVEVSDPSNIWTLSTIEAHSVKLGEGRFEMAPPIEDIVSGNDNSGRNKRIPPKTPIVNAPELPTVEEWEETHKKKKAPVYRKDVEEVQKEVQNDIHSNKEQRATVKKEDSNPVSILVNSSKKKEADVDLTITMLLPSKELYNIASTQFDDGKDKFLDTIINGLDTSDIIKSVRSALESYYSGEVANEFESNNEVEDDYSNIEPSITYRQNDVIFDNSSETPVDGKHVIL